MVCLACREVWRGSGCSFTVGTRILELSHQPTLLILSKNGIFSFRIMICDYCLFRAEQMLG